MTFMWMAGTVSGLPTTPPESQSGITATRAMNGSGTHRVTAGRWLTIRCMMSSKTAKATCGSPPATDQPAAACGRTVALLSQPVRWDTGWREPYLPDALRGLAGCHLRRRVRFGPVQDRKENREGGILSPSFAAEGCPDQYINDIGKDSGGCIWTGAATISNVSIPMTAQYACTRSRAPSPPYWRRLRNGCGSVPAWGCTCLTGTGDLQTYRLSSRGGSCLCTVPGTGRAPVYRHRRGGTSRL